MILEFPGLNTSSFYVLWSAQSSKHRVLPCLCSSHGSKPRVLTWFWSFQGSKVSRHGLGWPGTAWHGLARPGVAWSDLTRFSVKSWRGLTRCARCSFASHTPIWVGGAQKSVDTAWHGLVWICPPGALLTTFVGSFDHPRRYKMVGGYIYI